MPTPTSGPISIGSVNQHFGWGNDLNAYRGRRWYQPNSLNTGLFSGGQISLAEFYNKQPNDPASSGAWDSGSPGWHSITVPLFRNGLQVQVWGAGGAGGPYDRNGPWAGSGQESRVYLPNGEQVAGYGGGGGQGAGTDRYGGVRYGSGGGGGGAGGGNQWNEGGQGGGAGDNSYGGYSPYGGGSTGVDGYQEYETSGPNGNWPGGGGGGFNVTFGGRFAASSGGGGGGGYARSFWGGGTFTNQTISIFIGAGGGGGCSAGANGRVRIEWW